MSFRRLAWAFPAAYLVHVAEEAPGFVAWAKRNASPRYSERDFATINSLGFLSTVAATSAVTRADSRRLDLAYYTLVVTQQAAFNTIFHSVTTIAFREYSPGLITSILTVPLWRRLTAAAIAEDRLGRRAVAACFVVAGIVHAGVLARQVFFVRVPDPR
jgi:hypothetical protein